MNLLDWYHLNTPHSTLYIFHSSLHTLHFTLLTPHFTLHTPHFPLYTPHSTLYTLHSTLHAPHFTHHTPHSTLYTLHFTLYTPHSTHSTPHCRLVTGEICIYKTVQICSKKLLQKSVLRDCISMCFDITTINIRVSIRVRGLHLVLFFLVPVNVFVYLMSRSWWKKCVLLGF